MARRGSDDQSSAAVGAGLRRLERLRLSWAGRRDGRHRRPRLGAGQGLLTTPVREAFMDDRDLALQRLWAGHIERITPLLAGADELRVLLRGLQAQADQARRDRDDVDGGKLATVLTERRFGEEAADEMLVRRRRQRDRDRRTSAAAARLSAADRAVAEATERLAGLEAECVADRRRTVQRGRTVARRALSRRGVYDAALLARHPQAHLVGPVLDPTVRQLPAWLASAPPDDMPGEAP